MFIGEPPAFPDLSRDLLMQWNGSGIGQILLWQRVFLEQQPSRTGMWWAWVITGAVCTPCTAGSPAIHVVLFLRTYLVRP